MQVVTLAFFSTNTFSAERVTLSARARNGEASTTGASRLDARVRKL